MFSADIILNELREQIQRAEMYAGQHRRWKDGMSLKDAAFSIGRLEGIMAIVRQVLPVAIATAYEDEVERLKQFYHSL